MSKDYFQGWNQKKLQYSWLVFSNQMFNVRFQNANTVPLVMWAENELNSAFQGASFTIGRLWSKYYQHWQTVGLNVTLGATMECLHKHPFVSLNAQRLRAPSPSPCPDRTTAFSSNLFLLSDDYSAPYSLQRSTTYLDNCYCMLTNHSRN